MRNKHIIPLLLSLITIIGCTGGKVENRHGTQAIDTFYTGVRALSVHDTQPERALRILDSAVIVGNLSDFRADVLRAKVYGAAIETFQLDSSIIIGERLMLHDSIKADPDLQEDVLNILLNACRLRQDDERALYWATQLCELYRQRNEKVEALRTDAEIGMLLVRLGDQRRGLERIDSVIHLLEGKRKFNEMDASIIALKRKAEICCQKELFHELIPVGKRMLELLSDYEKYPQDYHDGNYREPPEDKRPNYIDFYRGKAYGYLAMAYAPSMEANRFIVKNGVTPKQSLMPKQIRDLLEGFIINVRLILPALGYLAFEPQPSADENDPTKDDLLYFNRNHGKGGNAMGKITTDGFWVLKASN